MTDPATPRSAPPRRSVFYWITILSLLACVSFVVAFGTDLRYSSWPQLVRPPADEERPAEPAPESPPLRIMDVELKRGATLSALLKSFGVDQVSAHAAVEALRPLLNPRKLRAGEKLRVLIEPDREALHGFEYLLGDSLVRVVATPAGWSAESKKRSFMVQSRAIHGEIRDNLYSDGVAAALTPPQILELATIFEYDIDFFSDFRKGDSFSVLAEDIRYEDGPRSAGRVLAAEVTAGGESYNAVYYPARDAYYDLEGHGLRRAFLKAPLSYRRISSAYSLNRRHPILRQPRPHRAIDYAAPSGTPVVAIGRGRVTYAGWKGGYGKLVEVKHTNGYVTRYAHFSRIPQTIRVGKRVEQGDVIGYVGETGHATGPHLHFEMLRGGSKINFLALKTPRDEKLHGEALAGFYKVRDRQVALLQRKSITIARSES
jgi:murein DD-endopeptidase MepM/ murein hydrolase activator NlpD